jgi:hypothetical protein
MTRIVNIVAGPGAGKTTLAALLFGEAKVAGASVEYVQEYAKKLVWLRDFDQLNNQHMVSLKQYRLLDSMRGLVDWVITDGSLLHGLWFNRHNPDNVSDQRKTEASILSWFRSFDNVTLFLERGGVPYEHAGRLEDLPTARRIDEGLKALLAEHGVPFTAIRQGVDARSLLAEIGIGRA